MPWFVIDGERNQDFGPISSKELVQRCETGEIATTAMVRSPDQTKDQWVPITSLAKIKQIFDKRPITPIALVHPPSPPPVQPPSIPIQATAPAIAITPRRGRALNDFLIAVGLVAAVFFGLCFCIAYGLFAVIRTSAKSEAVQAENFKQLSGLKFSGSIIEEKSKLQFHHHIRFTLSSEMKVPISRIKFVLMLEEKGRSTPYSKEIVDFQIPGGIEPGESKELRFEPTFLSAFGRVSELPNVPLVIMLVVAAYDAEGKAIADESREARRQFHIP